MEGRCLVGIDNLTPEILRAMWLRNLLTMYSEIGLGPTVRELYEITRDDLDLITLLISEERELEQILRESQPGTQRDTEEPDYG